MADNWQARSRSSDPCETGRECANECEHNRTDVNVTLRFVFV